MNYPRGKSQTGKTHRQISLVGGMACKKLAPPPRDREVSSEQASGVVSARLSEPRKASGDPASPNGVG